MRRLWVLVDGLPTDSPLWREEQWEYERWRQSDELLASVLETLDSWSAALYRQLGGKFKAPYKPIKFPRPEGYGPAPRASNRVTLDDMGKIALWFSRN